MKEMDEQDVASIDALRLVRAGYSMEQAIAMSDEIDKWTYEAAAIRAFCHEPARLHSVAPYLMPRQFEDLLVPVELQEQYYIVQRDAEVKLVESSRKVLIKHYEAIIYEEHWRDTLRGYRAVAIARKTGQQIAVMRCTGEHMIPYLTVALTNIAARHYKDSK